MCNLAVLVSGSGSNLEAIIQGIKSGSIDGQIKLVISDNQAAFGLERAKANGIPAYYIKNNSALMLALLKENDTDLVVLAGYLGILEKTITESYKNKIINIHPSLIPKYCGKGFYGEKVHQAVLENGEKESGATVHFVDSGIDTGPVIMQKKVEVKEDDTVKSLQLRVLEQEHKLLVEVIGQLCKERRSQDESFN